MYNHKQHLWFPLHSLTSSCSYIQNNFQLLSGWTPPHTPPLSRMIGNSFPKKRILVRINDQYEKRKKHSVIWSQTYIYIYKISTWTALSLSYVWIIIDYKLIITYVIIDYWQVSIEMTQHHNFVDLSLTWIEIQLSLNRVQLDIVTRTNETKERGKNLSIWKCHTLWHDTGGFFLL